MIQMRKSGLFVTDWEQLSSFFPFAPDTCERRPKPKWTCAWAFTRAPCSGECSARRGGSLMFGPQTWLWPIRWSLGGFLGMRAVLFLMAGIKFSKAFYFLRGLCPTQESAHFPDHQGQSARRVWAGTGQRWRKMWIPARERHRHILGSST